MPVLGIVPARGGSKRIPNKNITLVNGRPMMANILDVAKESGIFDKIHVSTDSKEIASVAADLGFKPHFMRDTSLADDYTPLQPVLKWVVDEFAVRGENFDTIFLLMSSAVLVEPDDLKRGLEVFNQNEKKKPLMVMAPYPAPIEWAFTMKNDDTFSPINPESLNTRSQDLPEKYYDAGLFGIYSNMHLAQEKSVGEHQYISIKIAPYKAIDIDTPEDLALAESLCQGLRGLPKRILP